MKAKNIIKPLISPIIVKLFIYILYIYSPSQTWDWMSILGYIGFAFTSLFLFIPICFLMFPRIAANVSFYYGILCMIATFEYMLCIITMEIHLIGQFSNTTDKIAQNIIQLYPFIPLIAFFIESIIYSIYIYKYYLFTESEKGLSYD